MNPSGLHVQPSKSSQSGGYFSPRTEKILLVSATAISIIASSVSLYLFFYSLHLVPLPGNFCIDPISTALISGGFALLVVGLMRLYKVRTSKKEDDKATCSKADIVEEREAEEKGDSVYSSCVSIEVRSESELNSKDNSGETDNKPINDEAVNLVYHGSDDSGNKIEDDGVTDLIKKSIVVMNWPIAPSCESFESENIEVNQPEEVLPVLAKRNPEEELNAKSIEEINALLPNLSLEKASFLGDHHVLNPEFAWNQIQLNHFQVIARTDDRVDACWKNASSEIINKILSNCLDHVVNFSFQSKNRIDTWWENTPENAKVIFFNYFTGLDKENVTELFGYEQPISNKDSFFHSFMAARSRMAQVPVSALNQKLSCFNVSTLMLLSEEQLGQIKLDELFGNNNPINFLQEVCKIHDAIISKKNFFKFFVESIREDRILKYMKSQNINLATRALIKRKIKSMLAQSEKQNISLVKQFEEISNNS